MERALHLARRALGSASPNPAVGAVIVRDGEVVGEGWTQPAGHEHAEIVALRQAGDRARGATLYTTLEPCRHHGKTPPCTDAILKAGVAEVRAATIDPNPRVNGAGMALLAEAGVRTDLGEREAEARVVIEAFAKFIATGTPFVIAKFAASLDGKIATRTGDSRWITGAESRRYVHELRSESDAVMVGVNTVLADDPQMTARNAADEPMERQPLRVVVDSRGRTPVDAALLSAPGRTLLAVADLSNATSQAIERSGGEVQSLPGVDGRVDLVALLQFLGREEITSVLVEGGGELLGSLFDAGLVDKVVAFIAPVIIGGKDAPSPVAGRGAKAIGDAMRLHRSEVRRFGDDVAVIGYCEVDDDVHGDR